jgi:hypothetical protein
VNGFLAVVLICPLSLSAPSCDETTAVDVLSVRVANELACAMGWQEVIARSAFRDEVGVHTYLKTLCRRLSSDRP